MRRFLSVLLALLLLAPAALAADPIDLSDMSFDDLVALREQVNLAIWNSQEWQEVTVPAGTWEIGKDIPAGHWTLTPMDNRICYLIYTSELDSSGHGSKRKAIIFDGTLVSATHAQHNDARNQIDLSLEDGRFLILDAAVTVTPYTGKPDLGFH